MEITVKPTDEIKISVIIPMYNVERVIDRCLRSLEEQSLQGVEYLFIDDCSTDGSVAKLSTWIDSRKEADVYYRIVQHKNNQGVAVARNTGLDLAKGIYVYYVDADDYIEPQTLKLLFQEAEATKADIVGCEWFLSFHKNERSMMQQDVQSGEELFKKIGRGVIRWNLWLFLVKRSLYVDHGVRFLPQMNMGEDLMVMAKLALLASKVHICHQPLYHYVQSNTNSLTKNYEISFPQIIANIQEINNFLLERNRVDFQEYIYQMQLNAKLPFLISSKTSNYLFWLNSFPEANKYIEKNKDSAWRTRFIQQAARARQFWILRVYYWVVIKVVYGFIYK